MFNSRFSKILIGVLAGGYVLFCTVAVIVLDFVDDFFLRWILLFILGLPFWGLFYKSQKEGKELACRDEVTGIANRRRLLEELDREFERARRYHRELSVLMMDIDNFKSINDTYGHLAGDYILRETSSILTHNLRQVDIAGRFGGDEFLVILPDIGYERAQHVAWRLWTDIHGYPFRVENESVHVSLGMGISSLQELENCTGKFNLINRADEALLNAKYMSRTRIGVI